MTQSRSPLIQTTGDKQLDDFVTSGFSLIKQLPSIWRKSIIYRFKHESGQLAEELKMSSVKTAMQHLNILYYINIAIKIADKTWWNETQQFINYQLIRYCYEMPLIEAWKHKNPKLALIAEKYKKYLLENNETNLLTAEDKQKKINSLQKSLAYDADNDDISALKKEEITEECIAREKIFLELKQKSFELLQKTQSAWEPFDYYPTLRPHLLIVIARMMRFIENEVTKVLKYKIKNVSAKLFSSAKELIEKIKILHKTILMELEKIAEVLLMQEQTFVTTGSADLIGKLSDDLNEILLPYLNNKQYNCRKLACHLTEWDAVDQDLALQFSKISHLESGIDIYKPFLTNAINAQTNSQFRQEFIEIYGTKDTKEKLKMLSPITFSLSLPEKIFCILKTEYPYKEKIQTTIAAYCKNERRRIGVVSRLKMLAANEPYSQDEMFNVLNRYANIKINMQVIEKYSALQKIYLQFDNRKAWSDAIKYAIDNNDEKFNQLLVTLLHDICNKSIDLNILFEPNSDSFQLNIKEISQFMKYLTEKTESKPTMSLSQFI